MAGVLTMALLACSGLDGGPCPDDIPESPFESGRGLRVIVADFEGMPGHAGDAIADALAAAIDAAGAAGERPRGLRMRVERMACRPADHADAHRLADRWKAGLVVWGGPCVANAVGSVCPRATVRRSERSPGGPPRADLDVPAFEPGALIGARLADPVPLVAFVHGFSFYEYRSSKRAVPHWLPIAPLDGRPSHGSWAAHRYLCEALAEVDENKAEAARHCRAAIAHMPDPDREPAGYVLNLLGLLIKKTAPADEVLGYLRRAVAIARAEPGDRTLLARLENLSGALADAGRFDDAVEALREAMKVALARPVIDGHDVLDLHEALGVRLWQAQRPGEALVHLRQAMAAPASSSSTGHSLSMMWVMAMVQGELEAHSEAADILRKAVALKKKDTQPARRDARPTLLGLLGDLGHALKRDEAYAEAEVTYREALALHEAADPPTPIVVAATLEIIGGLLVDQDRPEDALEPVQRAREIRVAEQGPGHPDVAGTTSSIGVILLKQKRFAEALSHFERARAAHARAGSASNRSMVGINLQLILAACGISRARCAEAEPLARRALAAGGAYDESPMLRWALAQSLVAARRYSEAAAELRRAGAGFVAMDGFLPSVGAARMLGMALAEANRAAARGAGVIVCSFNHSGPAPADVRPGDVIVRYGGQPVATVEALVERIESTPRPTPVVLIRDGRRRTVPVRGPAPIGLFQGMSPEPFWYRSGGLSEP